MHHVIFWGLAAVFVAVLAIAYTGDLTPQRVEVDGVTCITYQGSLDCNWTEHNRREFWGDRLRHPDLQGER